MVPIQEGALFSNARVGSPSSVVWHYLFLEFFIGTAVTGLLGFFAFVRSFLPKPPRDLTGNVVLVTGATSTLGKLIADEFARNGCTIIRVDGASEDSSSDNSSQCPNDRLSRDYVCDLWNVKAIGHLADRINRETSGVDVLVTCAGHEGQDIFDTVNVTLMSHYWTVLAFLPSMLKRGRAHIVGVTPTSSPTDAYAGSRAAIAGLMESLGQEFGGRDSRLNFITVAPKADPRLLRQSEEQVAKDVVQAVRRDRCTLSANWFTTLLDRLSFHFRGEAIIAATRWWYTRGCENPH